MEQFLHYFIIKVYKGLFIKKHKGNVHTFLIPTDKDYLFLAMLGELNYEPGKYVAQSIIKISPESVDAFIEHQKDYFGDKFLSVEKVKCISKQISDGMYKIKIGKAKHVLSDMVVAYNDEYSKQAGKPTYTIQGKFDLVWEDISDPSDIKSVSLQKMSIIGGVEKFKNLKQDVGELKMEQDDKTLKLACQAYLTDAIRESQSLRKKLSFSEHKKMFDLVNKMTLREMISAIFHDGQPITEQQEGKTKKALKYGGAGAAGALLARRYVGKIKGGVYTKAQAKTAMAARTYLGRKMPGKLGLAGAATAMGALYLYKRFTDKCRGMNTPKQVHLCKAAAAQVVIKDLKSALANCADAKCEKKMKNSITKWTVIYRKEREIAARPI